MVSGNRSREAMRRAMRSGPIACGSHDGCNRRERTVNSGALRSRRPAVRTDNATVSALRPSRTWLVARTRARAPATPKRRATNSLASSTTCSQPSSTATAAAIAWRFVRDRVVEHDVERACNGRHHVLSGRHRSELDQVDAVGTRAGELHRNRGGERRLAHAAGTGEGDERRLLDEIEDGRSKVGIVSDQRRSGGASVTDRRRFVATSATNRYLLRALDGSAAVCRRRRPRGGSP